MEIELIGQPRNPALQGIPSMEGITNKTVVETLKKVPEVWEAFWRSGRKRFMDLETPELKEDHKSKLLQERRERSRDYAKKKFEYLLESKNGAEAYKKEAEIENKNGVCRICSKNKLPIKNLEKHTMTCKKMGDLKADLNKINELLMAECKRAEELKENTFKLTMKNAHPIKKRAEALVKVETDQLEKEFKSSDLDNSLASANTKNTFTNTLANKFASDRKLIMTENKKNNDKESNDKTNVQKAFDGEKETPEGKNKEIAIPGTADTQKNLTFSNGDIEQQKTDKKNHVDQNNGGTKSLEFNEEKLKNNKSDEDLEKAESPAHADSQYSNPRSAPVAIIINRANTNRSTSSNDSSEEEKEKKNTFKPSRFFKTKEIKDIQDKPLKILEDSEEAPELDLKAVKSMIPLSQHASSEPKGKITKLLCVYSLITVSIHAS